MPGVVDALLDDDVAGAEGRLLAAVEGEHDLARQHDGVVEADGPVHGRAVARRHVRDAEGDASGGHAREGPAQVRGRLPVVDRDRRTGVEGDEGAPGGAHRREGFDDAVRVEHGGPVFLVGRDDHAGTGREGVV